MALPGLLWHPHVSGGAGEAERWAPVVTAVRRVRSGVPSSSHQGCLKVDAQPPEPQSPSHWLRPSRLHRMTAKASARGDLATGWRSSASRFSSKRALPSVSSIQARLSRHFERKIGILSHTQRHRVPAEHRLYTYSNRTRATCSANPRPATRPGDHPYVQMVNEKCGTSNWTRTWPRYRSGSFGTTRPGRLCGSRNYIPPSTLRISPVIFPFADEQINAIMDPTSSGVERCPLGVLLLAALCHCSV